MPPSEFSFPVDDGWRATIRSWTNAQKKIRGKYSYAELAKEAGMTAASLSDLLSGKTKGSRFVPAINAIVGLPPPRRVAGTISPETGENLIDVLVDEVKPFREEELQMVIHYARYLGFKRRDVRDLQGKKR